MDNVKRNYNFYYIHHATINTVIFIIIGLFNLIGFVMHGLRKENIPNTEHIVYTDLSFYILEHRLYSLYRDMYKLYNLCSSIYGERSVLII